GGSVGEGPGGEPDRAERDSRAQQHAADGAGQQPRTHATSIARAARPYDFRWILTPPLVVTARIRAPPAPSVVVSSRLMRPVTVMGKSTLIRPFVVAVSSAAE